MCEINNPIAKEFVKQVEDITNRIEYLISLNPDNISLSTVDPLHTLTEQIKTYPENELIDAINALKEMPSWNKLPDQLDDIVNKTAIALTQVKTVTGNTAIRSDCSLGDCPNGPSQSYLDDLAIAIASTDLATATAQAVAETLELLKLSFASKIAKVVAAGLDIATKSIAVTLAVKQKEANIVAECEDQAVKQLLTHMCNTLNVIDIKIDKIGAKLEVMDKKLDMILELLQEVKKIVNEILLHQIEEALSECKMLVGLYLPEENHGSILKVQTIVKELIYFSKISGFTVANAESYWSQGSYALINGKNESALKWFMLAYEQLQEQDMCKLPCPTDPCKEEEC